MQNVQSILTSLTIALTEAAKAQQMARLDLLASLVGVPKGTLSSWKTRGYIPVAYWQTIAQIAVDYGVEGVTYEALVNAHSRPRDAKVA